MKPLGPCSKTFLLKGVLLFLALGSPITVLAETNSLSSSVQESQLIAYDDHVFAFYSTNGGAYLKVWTSEQGWSEVTTIYSEGALEDYASDIFRGPVVLSDGLFVMDVLREDKSSKLVTYDSENGVQIIAIPYAVKGIYANDEQVLLLRHECTSGCDGSIARLSTWDPETGLSDHHKLSVDPTYPEVVSWNVYKDVITVAGDDRYAFVADVEGGFVSYDLQNFSWADWRLFYFGGNKYDTEMFSASKTKDGDIAVLGNAHKRGNYPNEVTFFSGIFSGDDGRTQQLFNVRYAPRISFQTSDQAGTYALVQKLRNRKKFQLYSWETGVGWAKTWSKEFEHPMKVIRADQKNTDSTVVGLWEPAEEEIWIYSIDLEDQADLLGKVSAPDAKFSSIQITMNSTGTVVVCWKDQSSQLFSAVWNSLEQAWDETRRLNAGGTLVSDVNKLKAASDGSVYVMWSSPGTEGLDYSIWSTEEGWSEFPYTEPFGEVKKAFFNEEELLVLGKDDSKNLHLLTLDGSTAQMETVASGVQKVVDSATVADRVFVLYKTSEGVFVSDNAL